MNEVRHVMSNMMELNKAAQARSDAASSDARQRCWTALMLGDQYQRQDALSHAMTFDSHRAAMFLSRFLVNRDKDAFIDGIAAIHGQIARSSLERLESPGGSALIVGGTFGGIG